MGVTFLWDRKHVDYGDDLAEFMKQIGTADFICIFMSEAYLKSFNCMNELFIAWDRSKAKPEELRSRLKIWVMAKANIFEPKGRVAYSTYWKKEYDKRMRTLAPAYKNKTIGGKEIDKHKLMRRFADEISNILNTIVETKVVASKLTNQNSSKSAEPKFPMFRDWVCNKVTMACELPSDTESLVGRALGTVGATDAVLGATSSFESKPKPLTPDEEADLARRLKEAFPAQIAHIEGILMNNEKLRTDLAAGFASIIGEAFPGTTPAQLTQSIWVNFHHWFLESTGLFVDAYNLSANKDQIVDFISASIFLSMCPAFASDLVAGKAADRIEVSKATKAAIAEMLLCWTQKRPLNLKSPPRKETSWESTPEMKHEDLVLRLMEENKINPKDLLARDQLKDLLVVERQFRTPRYFCVDEEDEELINAINDPRSPLFPLLLLIRKQGRSIKPGSEPIYDGGVEVRIQRFRDLISQSA